VLIIAFSIVIFRESYPFTVFLSMKSRVEDYRLKHCMDKVHTLLRKKSAFFKILPTPKAILRFSPTKNEAYPILDVDNYG